VPKGDFFLMIMKRDATTGKLTPVDWSNIEAPGYKYNKRKRISGTVDTPGTAKTLYSGEFIAESIIIMNKGTASATATVIDGTETVLDLVVSAEATLVLSPVFIPFTTNVTINSDSANVLFTFGGWTP